MQRPVATVLVTITAAPPALVPTFGALRDFANIYAKRSPGIAKLGFRAAYLPSHLFIVVGSACWAMHRKAIFHLAASSGG